MKLETRQFLRNIVRLFLAASLALVNACDGKSDDQRDAASETPTSSGFEAEITGAYAGQSNGDGVLTYLPDAGFDRNGYYFLADGQGLRDHGVTFILPTNIGTGRHDLVSVSPFDIGSLPSVRVDRDMGDKIVSSDRNISGYLELDRFPGTPAHLTGFAVSGSFAFQAEGLEARTVTVTGRFSFVAK
jgi:hypothetical protein